MADNTRFNRNNNSLEISPVYYLGKMFSALLRWLFLIAIAYVILYPLFYMLSMSFRATQDFYDVTVVWVPKTFTVEHFKFIFEKLNLIKPLLLTGVITILCTLAEMIICSTIGYGFARFKFKLSNILFVLVVFTIMVPPQMLNMSNYLLMKNFDIFGFIEAITGHTSSINLLDSIWAFLLPAITGQGIRSGLMIMIFRQFYASLPVELEEAALIDGCGFTKTYLRIMAPNLSNTFCLCAIFSIVWYWTDYFYSLTYLPTNKNMALQIENIHEVVRTALAYVGDTSMYNMIPKQQAACLLFILPLVIFFLIIQKSFSRSIENSGLVG